MICEECKSIINIKMGKRDNHCFCSKCYSKWRNTLPKRKNYNHNYYLKTKNKFKKRNKLRYKFKRKEVLEYHRNHNQLLRKEALKILGNMCSCCGLTQWWCLTIDHIKPLLKKKRISWQNGLYYEIINNPELAKRKYKCLCFGCNTSKNKYSKCNINHIET